MMREVLRWIAYVLLALIVSVVLVFSYYRLRGPSRSQREALALLHKNYKPKQGTNAFPLLWFMDYDVPTNEMDAKVAEEVADARKRLADTRDPFIYDPREARLPEPIADESQLCGSTAVGCLAKVEAETGTMRSMLAAFPVTPSREKLFDQTDYYWNIFPADYRFLIAPTPRNAQRVWLTALALRYVDGDRIGALAGVCRNIGAWRHMHGGGNSLSMEMISIVFGDGGLRLFADMLAKLPSDVPAPTECDVALRPIEAADLDRCGEFSSDLAESDSILADPAADLPWWSRAVNWVTYDRERTQAWQAEFGANFCGKEATARLLRDEPLRSERLPRIAGRVECIANVAGCMFEDYSHYHIQYDKRTLDFAAHVRLGATLLWLRQDASNDPVAARFDRRPPKLRSDGHDSGIDAAKGILFVDNLDASRSARFGLPISVAMR
jgi:hypothetical protein